MNKRAVIITGPGFQDEEVVYPYYRLLEEGYQTDIATKDGEVVYGKYGVPARATMSVSDLKVDNFDMVIYLTSLNDGKVEIGNKNEVNY